MITECLDRVLTPKIVVSVVPKKDLMIVLPYLRKLSLQTPIRINGVMKSKPPYCNFRMIFHIKNYLFLRFCIAYQFKCGGWNAMYYGKTRRYFKVNRCEHLGVAALTGKRAKENNVSAIK